jgi:hypothetical protein
MAALLTGCNRQQGGSMSDKVEEENAQAKALLQGVWMDAETGTLSYRIEGDTIFYADSTSMPAYFRIIGDSLVFGSGTKYGIEKQTPNQFWLKNQNGDIVKLEKSADPSDDEEFIHDAPKVMNYTHQVKSDSAVSFNGERYHWYIAINPTKYKVIKRSYNDDGLEVENVYYDNIMHISVFNGSRQIFSSDFKKQQYGKLVPAGFLDEAILGAMDFDHIDADGLHFDATLCKPDGASCYMIDTQIAFTGKLTMKLLEY